MGFDWTGFGNGVLDGSGLTSAGNLLGITHTGPGGLTGNTHLLGNRLGADANKVLYWRTCVRCWSASNSKYGRCNERYNKYD